MSFLNPQNLPVMQFKSTDEGAPQIAYNARVAGDVLVVIKACLVTGYGSKTGAGWSIVNEGVNVAEFVSPDAAMSEYRLGVSDNSASSTNWHYYYNDAKRQPSVGNATKEINYTKKDDPSNGWRLLVTDRAVIFIHYEMNNYVPTLFARITYWGDIKSALSGTGETMFIINAGFEGTPLDQPPSQHFAMNLENYRHCVINGKNHPKTSSANMASFGDYPGIAGNSQVEIACEYLFFFSTEFAGQHPAFILRSPKSIADAHGVLETTLNGRPMLQVSMSQREYRLNAVNDSTRSVLIPLDYWEF